MRSIILFFVLMSFNMCIAQRRDLILQEVCGKKVNDLAVVQDVPYDVVKGYKVVDPAMLAGDAQVLDKQSDFDKMFVALKKSTMVNFDTHYVIVVSPNGEYKFRKFKIENVFFNNAGQIVVKTFTKANDYQTHVERLGTAPDGSKAVVVSLEGEPYLKAQENRPYILIKVARANNGNVVQANLSLISCNGVIQGTKEERKEILQLEREGKRIEK